MELPNNLETNGNLQINPLAELFAEIAQHRLSGSLRVAQAAHKTVVYFDAGETVFAASNARQHRLFELLLKAEKITKDQLVVIPEFTNDLALMEFLIKNGLLNQAEADDFFSRQIHEIVKAAIGWDAGDWTFSPLVRVKNAVRCAFNSKNTLADYGRGAPLEEIRRRLFNRAESFSVTAEMPLNINLSPPESFVYSRFENTVLTLGEIQTISGLSETETLRAVYVLWLGGFLTRENWNAAFSETKVAAISAARLALKKEEPLAKSVIQPPTAPATSKIETPSEIEAAPPEEPTDLEKPVSLEDYLARSERALTYYELFALESDADTAEIKQAYFGLARRFHPDLFHKEADAELVRRIQGSFGKVTQAYDTLKAASSREVYDYKMRKQLAEMKAVQRSETTHEAIDAQKQIDQAAENFERGFELLVDNSQESAVPFLARAVHLDPSNARYQAFYGKALATDNKQRHKAENALQTAVKLDGDTADYRIMLAEFYINFNLLKRAEGELTRLLKIFPDHGEAKTLLDSLAGK